MGTVAWPERMPEGWPETPDLVETKWGRGYRRRQWTSFRTRGARLTSTFIRTDSGLPLHAMVAKWRSREQVSPSTGVYEPVDTRTDWAVWNGSGFLHFPLVPSFGFAVDTAFYAAIAFTLWSAPGAIRRHRRQARGHCPACGYNLKGAPTPTCPECGA